MKRWSQSKNNTQLWMWWVISKVRCCKEQCGIGTVDCLAGASPLPLDVGEDTWESLGLQGDPTRLSERKSVPNIHWKDWSWIWNSKTLATWCGEPTHLKRPWYWERLNVGEGNDREWDGWMASPTWWTWVWASSSSWWWTGKPGMLQSMGSQRAGHNWVTELDSDRAWVCLFGSKEKEASVG